MTSKDYEKMAGNLEELSSQYAKAASESLKSSPGEFHRLMTLSEYATLLAEDLTRVMWRVAEKELSEKFGV